MFSNFFSKKTVAPKEEKLDENMLRKRELDAKYPIHTREIYVDIVQFATKRGLSQGVDYDTWMDTSSYRFHSGKTVYFLDKADADAYQAEQTKVAWNQSVMSDFEKAMSKTYSSDLYLAQNDLKYALKIMPMLNKLDQTMQIILRFYLDNKYPLPNDSETFTSIFVRKSKTNYCLEVMLRDEAEIGELSLRLKDVAEIFN